MISVTIFLKSLINKINLVCFIIILIICSGEKINASEYTDDEQQDNYIGTYHDIDFEIPSITESGIQSYAIAPCKALPSSYSSVEQKIVSPVKSQGYYGTCWAFSAVNSAESSILNKLKKAGQNVDSDTYNLSESQLVYFMYNSVMDPLGLTQGDVVSIPGGDYMNAGGNDVLTMMYLASWGGLADEVSDNSLVYENFNSTSGIDSAWAYEGVCHLENGYFINMIDMEYVKQAIVDYGALGVAYNSSRYNNVGYDVETASYTYYQNITEATDHAVSLVGWDDNFSKDNFSDIMENVPSANGAWLLKNSWGNNGDSGYIWISYEDKALSNGTAAVFEYDFSDNYDNNYQYDGGVGANIQYVSNGSKVANVFQTLANDGGQEELKAVSLGLNSIGVNYEVNIYLNPSADSPESGILVATQTGTTTYSGYHTIELNSPVILDAKDVFSVVFTLYSTIDDHVYCLLDSSVNYGWIKSDTTVLDNQSYLYLNDYDGWVDLADDLEYYTEGNIRIKAFTDNVIRDTRPEVTAFVTRLYTNVLSRDPEADGLVAWTDYLLQHLTCGLDIGYHFVFSEESLGRNLNNEDFLGMLYTTFMNRQPDSEGFFAWLSYLEAGVDREYVFAGFANSIEFAGICKDYNIEVGDLSGNIVMNEVYARYRNQNPNVTKFVARCYTKALGRNYDIDGLEAWCKAIILKQFTPKAVAEYTIYSQEFQAKNLSNVEYVNVLYSMFFDRAADSDGFVAWVNVLNEDSMTRSEALDGFADSIEFAKILAQYGLK